jgi:phage FluMu protein Com
MQKLKIVCPHCHMTNQIEVEVSTAFDHVG